MSRTSAPRPPAPFLEEGEEKARGETTVTYVTVTGRGVRLRLHVQPRSSQNRIAGLHGDAVKVQVTAPPAEGAANAAVVALVARWLGVPRRAVTLLQGQTGRQKVVDVLAADPASLARRVQESAIAAVDRKRGRA